MEAPHAAIETQLKAILARLAYARAQDAQFSDVFLVAGLLIYYLHKPGPERGLGVDFLQKAQKLGMRDPDDMEIVNNRERVERANADAVDKYLQMLDNYLSDDTVRQEVRQALLKRRRHLRRAVGRGRRRRDARRDAGGCRVSQTRGSAWLASGLRARPRQGSEGAAGALRRAGITPGKIGGTNESGPRQLAQADAPGRPRRSVGPLVGQRPQARFPSGEVAATLRPMSLEQIAAEALRLPPRERATLAESLWESLVDPFEVAAWTDDMEAVALALERDRQLETGEVQPVSHQQMMARLRG